MTVLNKLSELAGRLSETQLRMADRSQHMVIYALVALVILLQNGGVGADNRTSDGSAPCPATAKSTDEIVKSAQPFRGFGWIQTAQFDRWGRQIFALWYCPFSGRGDCYLYMYYYSFDKQSWVQFFERLVTTGGDLSPEMPTGDQIIIRNSSGDIALRESVGNFPSRKPD